MSATTEQPTVQQTETTCERAYWESVYQETVLRSGGTKAIAKVKAVLDEIAAERNTTTQEGTTRC